MCGIHVTISPSNPPPLGQDLGRRLRNRGPDHLGTNHARLYDAPCPLTLTWTSTVLSLRGDHIAKQPLVDDETGSVLCWNGEAWRIGGEALKTSSDTEAVFELLLDASRRGLVLEALRAIEGPFAFTYFDKPSQCLYYGRDRLGRRSLLGKAGDYLTLSSIAESPSDDWVEVEADGCYKVDFSHAQSLHQMTPSRHAWVEDGSLVGSRGQEIRATIICHLPL
jgi:asparagine synthetase B (glutamine-hydrolysing)